MSNLSDRVVEIPMTWDAIEAIPVSPIGLSPVECIERRLSSIPGVTEINTVLLGKEPKVILTVSLAALGHKDMIEQAATYALAECCDPDTHTMPKSIEYGEYPFV